MSEACEPGLAAFIARLPKAELHLHLEGAVAAPLLARLREKHGIGRPEDDLEALYRFADLAEFLRAYDLVCAALRDADDFRLAAYEALRHAAASNARHVELFFSPHAHAASGTPYQAMVDGILAGMQEAARDFGVEARLIPAHSRALGPAAGEAFLDRVLAYRPAAVIGIGLDYEERPYPPAPFEALYRRARAAGLRVTAHAGEDGPAAHVRESIDILGCRRIDHGYHVVDDPALVAACRAAGIVFTVCPTTTTHTTIWRDLAAPDHAIRRMLEAGLDIMVNTDDPGLFRTDLNREYRLLATNFGLSRRALGTLALAGLRAAWLDEDVKTARLAAWSAEIDALLAEAVS
jgi:adenosine deaminase